MFGYGVVHVGTDALRDPKGVLDPLEMELWTVVTVVSHLLWVLGTKVRSPERAVLALNY